MSLLDTREYDFDGLHNKGDLKRWIRDTIASEFGFINANSIGGLSDRLPVAGTADITFDGVVTTASVTVDHGMGGTPSNMIATANLGLSVLACTVGAEDDTQFTIQGTTIDGSAPAAGDYTVYWMASL
jgi:hypothetical protein